jgi:hypothetical protein
MNGRLYEYLLAMANTPQGGQSISDWRPFGAASLNALIDVHNRELVKHLRDVGWDDNIIEMYTKFVAASNYELKDLARMPLEEYRRVAFVFVDLEAVVQDRKAVARVQSGMNQSAHPYHVAQIGSGRTINVSIFPQFMPSPALPARPEVMAKQEDLEGWLANLRSYYFGTLAAITPVTGGGGSGPSGGAFGHYVEEVFRVRSEHQLGRNVNTSYADLAVSSRDSAMQEGLTPQQARVLAQNALLRNIGLETCVEVVSHRFPRYPSAKIGVAALHKPLTAIPIEEFYPDEESTLDLIYASLTHPRTRLSEEQVISCGVLGLGRDHSAAIVVNDAKTQESVQKLQGVIETQFLALRLPRGVASLILTEGPVL